MTDFANLPATAVPFMDWSWEQIKPYYNALAQRPLSAETVGQWLADWSRLEDLVGETFRRRHVAVTVDTTDEAAEEAYNQFLDEIRPQAAAASQELKEKLLSSDLQPDGFEIPLRNMRSQAALFRQANLPLETQESKLANAYNKIIGGQTVKWEGEELTLTQLHRHFHTPDRFIRERIWLLSAARRLEDRDDIDDLWRQLLEVRRQMAENAGFDNYRDFRWQQMLRFDYTPEDSQRFRQAIADVVVPAASRVYHRYASQMGVDRLRPWDVDHDVYTLSLDDLRPFEDADELQSRGAAVLHQVDPVLGGYFDTMRHEGLLDLPNRKGKAPGGYCTYFPVAGRPFIFMNAVGLPGDVKTLLHEAGHAFHNFERAALPYAPQRRVTAEFAEVASMAMELLAAPYLSAERGGFYADDEIVLARRQHLEKIILFWPYMAVVDGFQHWAYTHPDRAADPANCDAKWAELWGRFLPAVDWEEQHTVMATGWHRKQHIFRYPFYYVEYGMAQLGAIQVWRNARDDQAGAVRDYRQALALGGTRPLPDLYAAAGARFAFTHETVAEAVDLLEETIDGLVGG